MTQEFLFYQEEALEIPLDESICVAQKIPEEKFIISNRDTGTAEVYAPEIDYYFRNTSDPLSEQISSIKKLYEARASVYDLAQDMDATQEVGKKVLIVLSENDGEMERQLRQEDFTVLVLSPDEVTAIEGHIGALAVSTTKLMRGALETDQIIWPDAPDFAMKQSGIYDPMELGVKEVLQRVRNNSGIYHYKNYVQYDSTICQYSERPLAETCGKCEEVCPTVAIMKVDEEKRLVFSDVDCHGCGGCVSVCPSGALDFTQMPRDALSEAASHYGHKMILILPRQVEVPDIPLPQGVLPLGIEGRKYLHEAHFLMLLQRSGHAVIFYTDFVSKGTGDAIRIINEVFEKKYRKKAIYVCMDEAALAAALMEAEPIPECLFEIDDSGIRKRESFTYRLSRLVGEEDLGVVETGEHIHYGSIKINEEACTLCMSCVGACNVAALTAHPEDNTLKFNPSICTNCGYCEVVCPEADCVEIVYDQLALNPDYFRKNTMAHDELFACVECGTEFATKKAIEKIASMMAPRFGGNAAKIRTLYCCADCKPKVMLQAEIDQNNREKDNG